MIIFKTKRTYDGKAIFEFERGIVLPIVSMEDGTGYRISTTMSMEEARELWMKLGEYLGLDRCPADDSQGKPEAEQPDVETGRRLAFAQVTLVPYGYGARLIPMVNGMPLRGVFDTSIESPGMEPAIVTIRLHLGQMKMEGFNGQGPEGHEARSYLLDPRNRSDIPSSSAPGV